MARPVVLLLPGLLCDEASWTAQIEALSFAQCVVPSYGTLASIPEMASHVLARAPAERFSLAGHSMGGRVALEVMRQAPERIERFALLDSGVDPIASSDAGAHERAQRTALLKLARERGMRTMGQEWARGMVHPSRVDSPLFDRILDMIERNTPEAFEAQIEALLARPDARGILKSITCPTLLLCGRQDAWSPLSRHEQMHAMLPRSRLVVIEEAGHFAMMEQPEAVSRALLDWMQE
ncbi:alpha/beta fold hydrolase [Piscinibacter sp.]|uniref:alpha/beta fold hydrolase n=1 Tax=Piscinibacter sp. TaxID=1903157 RepID=UPI002B6FBC70|nr:alpha/beta hydrolase [Albitalea sp.]HUG26296.1 alpha/beta hydrolase [Albitalea sp.]